MTDVSDQIELSVNGRTEMVAVPAATSLMHVLRNQLGLAGVRAGCSLGECGACTVLADGQAIRSCITPLSEVAACDITTPEGLGTPDAPHAIQQAFLRRQAAQCGYCVNGIIMTAASMAGAGAPPDDDEVQAALADHLCRCGTHVRLLAAFRAAVGLAAAEEPDSRSPTPVAHSAMASSPTGELPAAVVEHPRIEQWTRLNEKGDIEIRPGKVELGQGIVTAFRQIVAAQLGIAVSHVRMAPTATGTAPDQGYTSASDSIQDGGTSLGYAAAALRRVLLERAAAELDREPSELVTAGRAVRSRQADGPSLTFEDLARLGELHGTIELQDAPDWSREPIGTAVPRQDLAAKLTGAAAYVQDLTFPDMLHARALLPPTYGAEPEGLDTQAARSLPGVHEIVRDGRLVLAIADREEQAIRAVERLRRDVEWRGGRLDVASGVPELLRELPSERFTARDDGDEHTGQPRRHQATFFKPYQAHGPMAPSAAVACDDDGTLTVWTHSQGVYPLRRELATLLGIAEARLRVEHVDGPGCYGFNGADDAAGFAAVAARAVPGRPVRFQFSIEDEFGWEPYGPAMIADIDAALSDEGRIVAWRHRTITDSHSTRPAGSGDRLLLAWLRTSGAERPWPGPAESGVRNAVPLYDLPSVTAVADHVRGPLRTGALRSLGSYLNVFAAESFMDELAELAETDPLEFRLRHLSDERARQVLEIAADRAGWTPHIGPSGRGLGVAIARYKSSKAYVAQVAEVRVDRETGSFRVLRFVVVCDAGVIVNPDGLTNQLEGGTLQGLSRATHEALTVSTEGVKERDWATYPVLGFRDVPQVDVTLVDRPSYPPLGAGESATPPVPAAVANALDDAIGIRLRELPLTPDRLQRRLLSMDEGEMARVRL